VTVTFEDSWQRRLPAPADLPGLLPTIEAATESDRQVAVLPRSNRDDPPVSLDGLAAKPWVDSIVLGWDATASVPLPGLRSLIALPMHSCDAATYRHLPNLEQLAVHDALPEWVASLPRLREAAFDWALYDYPPSAFKMSMLDNPAEREPYRRPTEGAPALAGLSRTIERLSINGFHYRDAADPVAGLSNLRRLRLHGWRNLRTLGRLERLESLELLEVEMANLRAFRGMAQLRELALMGRMKSLDGIEQLTALEDVWLRGRVMRDTTPLAALPNLRSLTLMYPDAVDDFTPLAGCAGLRYLEITLGNDTDAGLLPSISFLASMADLEDVQLFNVDIGDGRLDPLFELPNLRHVHLTGRPGPNIDELRRRRPDIDLEVWLPGEPEGRVHVGPVHYDPPFDGVGRWSILQSLADELGVETNSDAEERIRDELRRRDGALLKRLEFDSEAGAVGIYAADEADIRAVAEVVSELADRT
jgi:hypothetical protein